MTRLSLPSQQAATIAMQAADIVTWLLSSNGPCRAYKNYCGSMNLLEHVWWIVILPARDRSRQAAAIIGNPIMIFIIDPARTDELAHPAGRAHQWSFNKSDLRQTPANGFGRG
mgnify:CR=1 FL=1